jgi:hypothetical protein
MALEHSLILSETIQWLLESENPSVRYFTLTDILGKKGITKEVKNAKHNIMHEGHVPKILDTQHENGYWELPQKFYTAKYKGTVWQLIILAELGACGKDPRIKKACEFILEHSQDLESGGFSVNASSRCGGGRHSEVIPCLTGNMLWSLIKFGYINDHRIQKCIEWINTYQRFDDAIASKPVGWPYDKYETCWGRHSCNMGVVKTLKALSEIPFDLRSTATKKSIQAGIEYVLAHHIYKKSHDYDSISKPGWLKFGFPLMYQTDIVEILNILLKLECRDKRMQEAVDIVVSKQNERGKWILENTYNGRFQTNIEQKGKPSKWITLNALRVLKYFVI